MDKLAKEEIMKQKKPFDKCPVCGGELQEKDVEKLLKGGDNTAMVNVRAEVCLHCGERLYSQETVKCFEEIRRKLEIKDVVNFQLVGQSYRVTDPV
jgi:YgiT-type zinc finger domain-containing protein